MPRLSSKKSKVAKLAKSDASGEGGNLTFKVLIILLAGLFIYAPVFHGGWLWDDDQEITASQVLADPGGLGKIWSGGAGADYLPLKTTVQWVFYRFVGTNRTAWHLLNIAVHLMNALLIWKLLSRLGVRQAWLGGLLFCIHPILVESVAWVSELKNTLSLLFLLLASLAWINFDETRGRWDWAGAIVLFAAAILCKSAVVMFPLVILLYCWWKRQRLGSGDVLRTLPFFALSAGAAWVTIYFQFDRAIGAETIPVGGFLSRLATAGMAVWFYFFKCILPVGLLPIYPRWEVDPPSLIQFLCWPALAAVFFFLWTKRRSPWGRHVLFGVGFFLLNLFPILGFITMSYMRITWVADHFLYLPVIGLIGLATAAAGMLHDRCVPDHRRYVLALGLAVFAVLVVQSHRYAGVFANEYAMWTYTLKRNPNAWQAHSRLGKVMLERGDNAAAFYHIKESVRLRPDLAETHNNFAAMLEKKGDRDQALEHLRIAVEFAPDIPIYKVNLASLLVRMHKYAKGCDVYEALLKVDPENATFLCNRGVALYFLGRNEEAIQSFEKALAINPDLKDAQVNLAAARRKQRETAGENE